MSDERDPELRSAFEEEPEGGQVPAGLRGRVIARAVASPRRPGRSPWTLRLAPALAALLVVAAVGLYANSRTAGPEPEPSSRPSPQPTYDLLFGRLPAPALHPAVGLGAGPGAGVAPYYGPASMTWSGQAPIEPAAAPVLRFTVPGPADANALAARLAGSGYQFRAVYDDPTAQLPLFYLDRPQGPAAVPGPSVSAAAAQAAAEAEIARLGLTPAWPATTTVTQITTSSGSLFLVHLQRAVPLAGGQPAGLVDGGGDPAGLNVAVDGGGSVLQIVGLIPAASEQADPYPLRSAAEAAREAPAAPPALPGDGPPPSVALTQVQLVYTVVRSGGQAYLEPAYLFSGAFTSQGQPLEKRVLVPALDPTALGGT